jgi:hypothetical protein
MAIPNAIAHAKTLLFSLIWSTSGLSAVQNTKAGITQSSQIGTDAGPCSIPDNRM